MRMLNWILLSGIVLAFVFCGACIQSQESTNNAAATITETPMTVVTTQRAVTPIPTTIPTRIITRVPTPEPEEEVEPIEPEWTEEPIVYPTANPDINGQNFTKFKNGDFMAEYPGDWAVVQQTYELSDTTIYGTDVYKKEGRMVTFTSQDGNTSMIVTTYDYIAPKRQVYNPTIETARKKVQGLFPNVSADTSVYNYYNQKNEQGIVTNNYDVVFTPDEEYYPYCYTEQTWLTFNHYFIVDFVSKSGNLFDYNDLKYKMMKSVITEGMQTKSWWV